MLSCSSSKMYRIITSLEIHAVVPNQLWMNASAEVAEEREGDWEQTKHVGLNSHNSYAFAHSSISLEKSSKKMNS